MRFITADKVFNGSAYLPANTVLVLNTDHTFREFVPEASLDRFSIEYLDGIITPGFVNAHCHLELSHLKDKIPQGIGLPAFAREVVRQRNSHPDEIAPAMADADRQMRDNGIVAVGDISNTTASIHAKQQSAIHYHTFVELIGLNPSKSENILASGIEVLTLFNNAVLSASLAPHAPYSTSTELIRQIAAFDTARCSILSIHNQESDEETKFMMGEPGGFDELYRFLNLDLSWYEAPKKSSLQSYGHLLPANASILVHNTVTRQEDIDFIATKNPYWCLCPNANRYIENKLPDLSLFRSLKERLCLGTDSLASNAQLNLLAEAEIVLRSGVFSEEEVLAMLTLNGARALGLHDRFGQFMAGKNTGLNLISIQNSDIRLIQKIY